MDNNARNKANVTIADLNQMTLSIPLVHICPCWLHKTFTRIRVRLAVIFTHFQHFIHNFVCKVSNLKKIKDNNEQNKDNIRVVWPTSKLHGFDLAQTPLDKLLVLIFYPCWFHKICARLAVIFIHVQHFSIDWIKKNG